MRLLSLQPCVEKLQHSLDACSSSSTKGSSSSAPLKIFPAFDRSEPWNDLTEATVIVWAVLAPASGWRAVNITWKRQLLCWLWLPWGLKLACSMCVPVPRGFHFWEAWQNFACSIAALLFSVSGGVKKSCFCFFFTTSVCFKSETNKEIAF